MNISAPLRTTYLRATVYNPSYGQNGIRPQLPTLQGREGNGIKRARQFSPLDYATYKQKCNEDRFSVTSYEVDIDPEPAITQLEYSGPLNRLKRMCTVFPYKDISWQVAVIFFFTNATWLINSFFGFLPIVAPNTNFNGEKTIAVPTTLTIAATTFLLGICLGLVGAFNVDRGDLTPDEKADARKLEEGVQATATYKPALLGSSAFVWWPTLIELKTIYMPNPAFQAGLIQLLGAAIFTISNISSYPGLIDPKHQSLSQILIFLPTLLGGLCFFTAGLVLMVLMQEKWWKPKIFDVNWHVYFWSAVGAFGFVLTGSLMLLLPGDKFASGLAAFVGRWAFLIGSFLQWYVLMEFYPE